MTVSVMILTLNEEINIRECIESVAWSDDVIVFDSFSSDETVNIANELGARVIQRTFDNWSSHQNWAVTSIEFKNPWVFYIDADERCTGELAREINEVAAAADDKSAFRVRRKDHYMGTWLKRSQLYPTWIVRLFRPEKIRYERLVNPIAVVEGEIGELNAHLFHYPFSHGVAHWINRHNNYSDMESEEAYTGRLNYQVRIRNLISSDPNIRRAEVKKLFYRLPARPLIKFVYYYVIRRGFLDGRAGLSYSTLQAIYEYFIALKTRELRRKKQGLPI